MLHQHVNMLHYPIISAAFGALFATGVILDENSLVPIGTLGAVCAFVWWIGRKLQRIDDRLEQIERQSSRMEEETGKLSRLPCVIEGSICEEAKSKKKPLHML